MYSRIEISLFLNEFKYREMSSKFATAFFTGFVYIGLHNKKPVCITLYYLFMNNKNNLHQNQCLWVPLHEYLRITRNISHVVQAKYETGLCEGFHKIQFNLRAVVWLLGKSHVQSFCMVQFSNKVPVLLVLLTSVTSTSRVDDILLVR